MTKPPLHNIDSLFQEKLEDLPVDMSQQQAQWLSLSKTMHPPLAGLLTKLSKPWVKWVYLTAVALVPFGVFYITTQTAPSVAAAQGDTGGCVTRSLKWLSPPKHFIQPEPSTVTTAVATPPAAKQPTVMKPQTEKPLMEKMEKPADAPPVKSKDSLQAAPIKKELPVKKKTDSSYIYWQ